MKLSGLTNNELLTLSALNIKEMYGYELVKCLAKYETKVLIGSMYNILYRMEKNGFVAYEWGEPTDTSARRKYYQITDDGKTALMKAQEKLRAILDFKIE